MNLIFSFSFMAVMRPAILVLFFLLCILQANNTLAQDIIWWDKDRPLAWDDFKAHPPKHPKRFAAVTSCAIYIDVNDRSPDSAIIDVKSLFRTNRSWKRSKHYKPYLLKHEQSHFDIAEVYALRMKQAIVSYKHWYLPNGSFRYDKMTRISHRYRRRCRFAQYWYDLQTKHSRRKERQAEWNAKIATLLSIYEQYDTRRPSVIKRVE